ncbi:MAG: RluA family pseudouridine synthase [Bacteroidota bacterium]
MPDPAVLYEDDYLLIANKPAGLLTQASGVPADDETNLERELGDLLGHPVWVAHRLDKATSGLVLVSKDAQHLPALQGLFQARQITKEYHAVVVGSLPQLHGEITTPLAVPHEPGKVQDSRTDYRVLASHTFSLPHHRPNKLSLTHIQVKLHTGRKHQIRRHFGGLGYPLLGDLLYGKDNYNRIPPRVWQVNHLWLHSHQLAFQHPMLGRFVACEAPAPASWNPVLRQLTPLLH